jgi:hypothetical protein
MLKDERLFALEGEAFPEDPDFPQLKIAADPALMLEVFREHLKPISSRVLDILECIPFRFRCRQSTDRCVLQYTLRLADPATHRQWDTWATGLIYTQPGEAKRLWQEAQASDPRHEVPSKWLTFEPVCFIPDLQMVVTLFPYDRKLRNLSLVLGGALLSLEPQLLAEFGPGQWRVEQRTIEPTRYRTEMGAALKYTLQARDGLAGASQTRRFYLKVYRNDHGQETLELLQSFGLRRQAKRDAALGSCDAAIDSANLVGASTSIAASRFACRRTPKGSRTEGHAYSVVRPIAYLAELRTLVLEEAAGTSLQQLLVEGGQSHTAVRAVARAVAAFNQSAPLPSAGRGVGGQGALPINLHHHLVDQFDDVNQAAMLVRWACPELRAEVNAITAAVVRGLKEVAPAPIHRDLKPDHIFLDDGHVIFIDLDSAAVGDPARDPAHLFAHLIARVGMDSLPPDQARAAAAVFVEEYFAHAPMRWWRQFPLHCAGALLEVARGIFKRQEPRWPEKVAACVAEAGRALSHAFPL